MDDASFRRGKATIHRQLFTELTQQGAQRYHKSCRQVSNSHSVILSDVLFGKAQSLMTEAVLLLSARGCSEAAHEIASLFFQLVHKAGRFQYMDITGWRAVLAQDPNQFHDVMQQFVALSADIRIGDPLRIGHALAGDMQTDSRPFSSQYGAAFHVSTSISHALT